MSRTELLQRAIHSAKCRIYRINYDLNCNISLNHQRKAENQKELMDITVEALEKQIPKKPTEYKEFEDGAFYNIDFMCSACNNAVIGQPYKPGYCKHCGQALDWE